MKFGPVPLDRAEGAILAHSVQAGPVRLRKGLTLGADEVAALRAAGLAEVTVARIEPGDVGEDAAAQQLAAALAGPGAGLRVTEPFTGRVNLVAEHPGLFRVDAAAVNRLNAVDPGITLATLPDFSRVAAGTMVATAKIIPYAVPGDALARALGGLPGGGSMSVASLKVTEAALILTRTPGFARKLIDKGAAVVAERMAGLGVSLASIETVPHETGAVGAALGRAKAPLVLVMGASATSDPADVCPAAVVAAGGELIRFGMPVDPGNLLFLGRLGGADVVGLPGCARSPALNGADWVLERLVCGLPVGEPEIAAMGVGGLLKEIPLRPQPRAIRPASTSGPRVEILLLAAGASRRMGGADKLVQDAGGQPLLRRAARAALGAGAAAVRVVLPPDHAARRATLEGLDGLSVVEAPRAQEGMGASLATGIAALGRKADAVIVALADMPDVTAQDYRRLIAAFDPEKGHEICRGVTPGGVPGHPVLFGRRFFENLADLGGDRGARDVIAAGADFLADVPLPGMAAVTDLDTPEDWATWQRG
ncbi:NTP transferase domain-containing protein [Halovulum dunhuangense]|uniref:NTP transferase domain-containing protein n=1 Tax=Halovulum dunhuangense TaxID=1505036 RepID=A0A849L125_9RHOB|nr:NTP transferase domain-containing protein [Halovulum dunhuangense]